jgi:hypothetical protein
MVRIGAIVWTLLDLTINIPLYYCHNPNHNKCLSGGMLIVKSNNVHTIATILTITNVYQTEC